MRCICGCDHFERKDNGIYEEGFLVEYTTYCVNCDNKIMTYAYGSEFYDEDNIIWD